MFYSRELIFDTLFQLLRAKLLAPNLVRTMSRRAHAFIDVPQWGDQPAVYQMEGAQKQITTGQGMPYKWELDAELLVYTTVGEDPSVVPSSALNPIIDAIEAACPPQANAQNPAQSLGLGPSVSSVRFIDAQINEGYMDGQSICHIILKIVAT